MSDKKLSVNLYELIRDAYYAIPDFTDSEGFHISGIYGSFYKLKSLIESETPLSCELSFEERQCVNPAVEEQVKRAKELFLSFSSFDDVLETAADDSFKAFLSDALVQLSPSGQVSEVPRFKHQLTVVSDLSMAEEVFEKAKDKCSARADSYTGFFFATEPQEGTLKGKKCLGLALCFEDDNAYYIPAEGFITDRYLEGKLSELSRDVNLATFDIKSEYRLFTPYEISSRTTGYDEVDESYNRDKRCFDVLIGAYLLNPLKNDYEIWDISSEYLGITLPKKSDTFGKIRLSEAEPQLLSDYMGKAAFVCYKSAPLIRARLAKTGMEKLFYNIEMPLSYILYAMEKEGIIARKDALKEYGDKLSGRITELEKSIYEAAGCEFNINSPKQLGEILFERLKLPAEKKTKSGYSTAADVLEKLAPEHRIVADILEYRGLAKLKSTYADGLAAFIEDDNRIHTSFNQTITATGRISSTEPNLQNIPMRTELGRMIRKVFVPAEGCVFADADYSQIELRILAHMSEDAGLISAYHEGDDIHRITASKVFHVPFEDVTPLQRRNAKAVNFGIVYGISSFGLSQDLSISVSEAKEYMEKYFETYPGVRAYQNKVIQDAKNKGYSTTMFGRRRPIPELKSANFNLRQFGERVAMNAPIQGTAADIMKIAMINVFFRLKRENLMSRLILQIHDELVIETYLEEEETVRDILVKEMESAAELSVPMEVDCHSGSDWYEAK